MKKYPTIWKIKDLVTQYEGAHGGAFARLQSGLVPSRPLGFPSLRQRLRAAKLVFAGKADAVIWEGGQ